jgi:tungstate transport system ATP-binding protein
MHAPIANLPIVFDSVSLFAGAANILDGVCFSIGAGAPTLVIGPNGAGKTTLLRVAMQLVAPSRGRIRWGGRDAPPARQANVFQRPVMLRRTGAGNNR